MNRIDNKFAQLKAANRKALIPYITAGDPDLESNVAIMNALVDGGADLIELGIPFSDPAADGETIQLAGQRALSKGMDFIKVLSIVRQFRQSNQETPIILMGYLNSFERHGIDNIFTEIATAGADGVILVDCTIEGLADYKVALDQAKLSSIQLIAPTTTANRAQQIADQANGFIYYVSLRGVTGKQKAQAHEINNEVTALKTITNVPICVGFGIRDEQTAHDMAEFADGVIIGSALVKLLYQAQELGENIPNAAETFIRKMRLAIDA